MANVGSLMALLLFWPTFISAWLVVTFQRTSTISTATRLFQTRSDGLSIRYSSSFQRHVLVCQNATSHLAVIKSFAFLDEALESYPDALVDPCYTSYITSTDSSSSVSSQLTANTTAESSQSILFVAGAKSQDRIASSDCYYITPACKSTLLESLISKIETGSASKIRLEECTRERLQFLTNPMPDRTSTDWPRQFYKGRGAGLTIDQALQIIQHLPHLLWIGSQKPPLFYFYQQLKVPIESCNEARVELDYWLMGATPSDVATFAFLYKAIGVRWDQCRIILSAFPSLIHVDIHPGWELQGPVRSVLRPEALDFLRARLQVVPSEIFAMLKTHSRLSTYSLERLEMILDALQQLLGLSSVELRKIVLRMPSLMGASMSTLSSRVDFFLQDVGMTQSQLRKAILKQPSLLQYSIEANLVPKLDFLRNELQIPSSVLGGLLSSHPSILGRSLERTLRPTASSFVQFCNMSMADYGGLVCRAPELLVFSWTSNLEPTLDFLMKRLNLTQAQLRAMVAATPRILAHSIDRSLGPKLQILENAAENTNATKKVLLENPSLLLTRTNVLTRRVKVYKSSNATWAEAFGRAMGENGRRKRSLAQRPRRPVIEMSVDQVRLREYPNAKIAAKELGISLSYMYNILGNGLLRKGRLYVYGSTQTIPETKDSEEPAPATLVQDIRQHLIHCRDNNTEYGPPERHLRIFVSGRAFPPENLDHVRGRRRAGGLAIYVPQVSSFELRRVAETCFAGQIMPRTSYTDGTILLAYPYKQPSRNRCGLYVCRNALQLVSQLQGETRQVEIVTDSNYVWELLRNATQVARWGSHGRPDDFDYGDHSRPLWLANPDILYPLSRTVYRLVTEGGTGVSIRHRAEVEDREDVHVRKEIIASLGRLALQAAEWQYERARKSLL